MSLSIVNTIIAVFFDRYDIHRIDLKWQKLHSIILLYSFIWHPIELYNKDIQITIRNIIILYIVIFSLYNSIQTSSQ